MRVITIGILFICFLLLTVTPAAAQQGGGAQGIPFADIAVSLGNVSFWVVLLVTMLSGAVGGVVYELTILQGNIELPHRPTKDEIDKFDYATRAHLLDLGIFARVIIGALAAVAALLVLSPDRPFTLLATSVVAGSAGIAVFRSVQDRVMSALAQQQAAEARAAAVEADSRIERALALLETPAGGPGGEITPKVLPGMGEGEVAAAGATLTEVQRLLNEARGIHSLQRR
jgi:hypothetical protein